MKLIDIMYIVWVVIIIAAVVTELYTQQLIGWAASVGALFAAITHIFTKGDPLWIEWLVFIGTWVALWALLFIFVGKKGHKLHDSDDGYLSYIGKTYTAIKGNEEEFGQVKTFGKTFRFKSKDKISKGDKIVVKTITGTTMHVEKCLEKGDK